MSGMDNVSRYGYRQPMPQEIRPRTEEDEAIEAAAHCCAGLITLPLKLLCLPFTILSYALQEIAQPLPRTVVIVRERPQPRVEVAVTQSPVRHRTRHVIALNEEPHVSAAQANIDLLYAVKGIKSAVAAATLFVNPLVAAGIALYPTKESSDDLRKIDRCLQQGANINYQEERSGYTPLIYAAYHGYPNIAAHLVRCGANVQLTEDKGYNAYTMAQYYVNRYTKSLEENNRKPLSDTHTLEDKQRMHEFYTEAIGRYQKIVDFLHDKTAKRTMPRSFF